MQLKTSKKGDSAEMDPNWAPSALTPLARLLGRIAARDWVASSRIDEAQGETKDESNDHRRNDKTAPDRI